MDFEEEEGGGSRKLDGYEIDRRNSERESIPMWIRMISRG